MRIRDVLSIKEFNPVVDLSWGLDISKHEQMLSNYIMTEDTADIFTEILESLNLVRSSSRRDKLSGDVSSSIRRAHIISGQYGTGKSYFLLMLSIVLEMKNIALAERIIERFKEYPELQYQLKYIKENKKYFVVRINGELENEKEFKDVIQSRILESLKKEFLDIKLSTVYQTMIKALENMYLKRSDEIDEILEKTDDSFDDLIASLCNYKKSGLKKAENLIESINGFKSNIEIESLDKFLNDINKELKLNGYDELVIIFDEFSAYITSSVENKRINKDLGQIQTLAQLTSANSSINISFIASIHKDIKEILNKFGNGNNEEMDKVLGRFSTFSLKFNQGNDLIKDSLKLNKYEFLHYENKYKEYLIELEKKYKINFLDFYPFHPSTIEYLDPISQIYAQKTRTTLGFIREVVKEKFFYKEIEENNKLNLITLENLFDSFEESINDKNPEVIKIYNQNTNNYLNDKDVIKYIKALAIAYASSITKTNSKNELTAKDLKCIYQEKDEEYVKESLNKVINANYSNVIINNGKYRMLVNTSGIDIEKKIIDTMVKISPDIVVKNLLRKSESRIVIKECYNIKYSLGIFPFNIELDGSRNSVRELFKQTIEEICETNKSGKIIFVIPEFQEEYDKNSLIKKYSKEMEDKPCNICIAFPEKKYFNAKELKEYGALIKIENEDENIVKNDELKKIIIKRRRKLEDKIRNKYIRQFSSLRNFTFVFGGGKIDNGLRQERKLYEEILYNYYSKFPTEIKVENFNTRAALNEIIKISLDRGIGEIGKKDTSVGAKQLKLTLEPLDLITFTATTAGFKFELKLPEEENSKISKEIMDIILKEENIDKKYEILTKAPYGLNRPLVDLYIYVASKTGRIVIYLENDNKKAISLDSKSIEIISQKSKEYKIKLNEEANIPNEVEEIWKALNSLRIVTSSKARSFKANSNNDFNPFTALSQELGVIQLNLSEREERLKEKGVKTGKLKTLSNKIKEIKKVFIPNEFFNLVVTIPEIFKKKNYNENLEELKLFLESFKKITNNELTSFEKTQDRIKDLNFKIENLSGYSDLKEQLKSLKTLTEDYQNDFLNLDLLHELVDKTEKLQLFYNNEYKTRHDKYHREYNILRRELITDYDMKIKAIKSLQKLKFKNISSIEKFIDEIENYRECILNQRDDKILICKECKIDGLKRYEENNAELISTFGSYKRRILGIFDNYSESLKQDKIRGKMIYNEDYKELMIALNNIDRNACIGTEANVLSDKLDLISEELNILIDNKIISEKNINFDEITSKLLLELHATGSKYLELDDIKLKFDEIIDNYKLREIKTAKI